MTSRKRRSDLSIQEKFNILKCYDKLPSMSQRKAANYLQISQPMLCKILQHRKYIENAHLINNNLNRKRERSGKDDQVEKALKDWFCKACENNEPINGPILCRKAEEIAKNMGKNNFKASNGWFGRWKKREQISFRSINKRRNNENQNLFINQESNNDDNNDISETISIKDDENEYNMYEVEIQLSESFPTDAEMIEALNILRLGVQYRTNNFEKHLEYENYIRELIESSKNQSMIPEYFRPIE